MKKKLLVGSVLVIIGISIHIPLVKAQEGPEVLRTRIFSLQQQLIELLHSTSIQHQESLPAPNNFHVDGRDAETKLSWDSVDGADVYVVKRRDADSEYRVLDDDVTETLYTDSEIPRGGNFYYTVTAVDARGDEGVSSVEKVAWIKIGANSGGGSGGAFLPSNTVAPTIDSMGTFAGQTLTGDKGTWIGDDPLTYTYQWYADGDPIDGATDIEYTVSDDACSAITITLQVTATNNLGSSTATSAETLCLS